MADEYGVNDYGDITGPDSISFISEMRYLCGRVGEIVGAGLYYDEQEFELSCPTDDYHITGYMIRHADVTEKGAQEFSEADYLSLLGVRE